MKREAIGIGENVMEAKENACKELGVETFDENIDFEILENPAKKVLGIFGGKKAKVRVFFKSSAKDVAKKFLEDVTKEMGLNGITVELTDNEEAIEFNIEGEDVGFVIGRRGETLDALQYLTTLVANKVDNSYKRVTINTGDYREKREKTLESLGRKLAIKCVKTGRKQNLEPMNPYERRVIHTAVQKVNGATSWSEGESINRHVVIGLDPKQKGRRRPNNGNRKPRRNIEEAPTIKREPLNEGDGTGLYGRIDK